MCQVALIRPFIGLEKAAAREPNNTYTFPVSRPFTLKTHHKKKEQFKKREKKGETHSSLNSRATKNKKEKAAFAERAHPREKLSFRLSSFFGGRRKKSEFCFTFSSPHFNNKNPSGE